MSGTRTGASGSPVGVLVRKSSREQTSGQWNAAALQACDGRRQHLASDGLFLGCTALGTSIDDAVRDHRLIIVDGDQCAPPTRLSAGHPA